MKNLRLLSVFCAISLFVLFLLGCTGSTPTTQLNTSTSPDVIDYTEAPTPEVLAEQGFEKPQISRVTAWQLNQMLETGDPITIIDTRGSFFYSLGYIPEAINIDYDPENLDINTLRNLPKDRLLVFYCDWTDDGDSASMAETLMELDSGYVADNIALLWKGYFNWQDLGYQVVKGVPVTITPEQITQDITVIEAYWMIQENLDNPEFVILDVRTPEENTEVRIEDSALIDIKNDAWEATIKALDRSYAYVVYWKRGGRSSSAMEAMQAMGFEEVYNMLGGITEWEEYGYPVIRSELVTSSSSP